MEVARCQSIKKASEHLFLAQQSLSQTIKNLEKELNFPLLNRASTGITLTEEGKLFVVFAQKVLTEQENFFRQIEQLQHQTDEQLGGTLQLDIFGLYNVCVLPDILNQFCLRYPNVAVNTTMMSLSDIERDFLKGQDDLVGMITLPSADLTVYGAQLQQQGLRLLSFAEGRYFLCCNKGHPLLKNQNTIVSLSAAIQYPIVQYSVDRLETDTLHKLLTQYGYGEKEYRLSVQSIHTWVANLLRGDKIGFLNEFILVDMKQRQNNFQDIVTALTDQPMLGTLACIVRQETSPLVERFLKYLPALTHLQRL